MRALILYASKHGQTRRIANHIADVMRTAGADTFVVEVSAVPRDVQPHAADVVIVAGSVYFGKHAKALERFVVAQRENLAKTRTAFVSVSGSARNEATRSVAEESARAFLALTNWTPGRVVDTHRDYDSTDWDAVTRFALEMAGKEVEAREPELALL